MQTEAEQKPKKIGRPSVYSEEIGETILARLADGESLRSICNDPDMPARSTVATWIVSGLNGFTDQYARARMVQAIRWAEEITEIADQSDQDWIWDEEKQRNIPNHDHIARARLRVDTRKWLLSKVLPKVYGDKVGLEITGKDGGPVQLAPIPFDASTLSPEDRTALRDLLLRARQPALSKDDAASRAQDVEAEVVDVTDATDKGQ